jgi:hypothetical protein
MLGSSPATAFCHRRTLHWRTVVLYTIALVLVGLWVLGFALSFTAGGLLHLLLLAAVVIVVFQLVSGRRVV